MLFDREKKSQRNAKNLNASAHITRPPDKLTMITTQYFKEF